MTQARDAQVLRSAAPCQTAGGAPPVAALREAELAGAGNRAVVAWVEGHRLDMAELNG